MFSGGGLSSGGQLSRRSVAWVDQLERLRSSGGTRLSANATSGQQHGAAQLSQFSHVFGAPRADNVLLSKESVRSVLRGGAKWTTQQHCDLQRQHSATLSLNASSQPLAASQPQLLSETHLQSQHLFRSGVFSQHEAQAQALQSLQMQTASRSASFFKQHSQTHGASQSDDNFASRFQSKGPGSVSSAAPVPDLSRRPSSQSQRSGERERQSAIEHAAALNKGGFGRSFELSSQYDPAGRGSIDGDIKSAPDSFLDEVEARLQHPVAARQAALRQPPLAASQGYSSSIGAASHGSIPDRSASSRVRGYSPGPGRILERMQLVEGMSSAASAIPRSIQRAAYEGLPSSLLPQTRPASSLGPVPLAGTATQQTPFFHHDARVLQKTAVRPQMVPQTVQHQQPQQGRVQSRSQRGFGDHFQPGAASVASGLRLPQLALSSLLAARSR